MEPTQREVEARTVSELLVYLGLALGLEVPSWVSAEHGNTKRADDLTALFCATIREMSDSEKDCFMWDGRNKNARKLADWYEEHKLNDAWCETRERRVELEKIKTRDARNKLTDEDFELLKRAIKKREL